LSSTSRSVTSAPRNGVPSSPEGTSQIQKLEGARSRNQRPQAEGKVEDPVGQPILFAAPHGEHAVYQGVDANGDRQHGDERDRHWPFRLLRSAWSLVDGSHEPWRLPPSWSSQRFLRRETAGTANREPWNRTAIVRQKLSEWRAARRRDVEMCVDARYRRHPELPARQATAGKRVMPLA
jgi:hypothetical protein